MGGDSDLTYFLHIPKTAGTSVHAFLSELAGPGGATPQLLWDDLIRTPEVLTETTRVVTGHFGGLFPLWIGEWPTILTMLREPVARAVSHINHVQREPSHPLHQRARGLSVIAYCADPVLRRTVTDFQARYLASLSFARVLLLPGDAERPPDGMAVGFETALYALDESFDLGTAAIAALDVIDGVGVAERLPESLQLFAAILGREWERPVPRLNVAHDGQRSADHLTDQERSVLTDCNTADLMVYRHAVDRLATLREQLSLS